MTKQAIFYLLSHDRSTGSLSAHEVLACTLATKHWRAGKRLLIACESREQAQRLDEALWQNEQDAFVPHDLAGNTLNSGTPLELSWPGNRGDSTRDLLINLQKQFVDFATDFHQVVDFVPYGDTMKKLARLRYTAYRRIGFNLVTLMQPS